MHFNGNLNELKQLLKDNKIEGTWRSLASTLQEKFSFPTGAMLWTQSTGKIVIQAKQKEKPDLENKFKKILGSTDTPKLLTDESVSIENQYLYKNVKSSELILGIVSPVGAKKTPVIEALKDRLKGFQYDVHHVRVSDLLPKFQTTESKKEYERITHYMKEGDAFRKKSNDNSILAACVAHTITQKRPNKTPNKTAYIIDSLKHPDEVKLLRKIYGNGFYLIGIHSEEKKRLEYLKNDKHCSENEAQKLIKIDEDESIKHGQKTRNTYHLADFFLDTEKTDDYIRGSLQRFLDLIFSHPYKNPTFDEFAMFMAFNSSVRSSDLSRQVGAIITQKEQIIATGCNDVPKAGGGQYWATIDEKTGEPKDLDGGKDFTRKRDSNKYVQQEIIDDIIKTLQDKDIISDEKQAEKAKYILKETQISDLTEFGRIIHAEMDALLSCNRMGVNTVNSTLYCTTFPCHNCAKHIIASGIKRVVYVEPYPKSKALEFYSDSINCNHENSVTFEPFIGVGPRRFLDLFSMNAGEGTPLKRKEKNGETLEWKKETATARLPLIPKSYIDLEREASKQSEKNGQ